MVEGVEKNWQGAREKKVFALESNNEDFLFLPVVRLQTDLILLVTELFSGSIYREMPEHNRHRLTMQHSHGILKLSLRF